MYSSSSRFDWLVGGHQRRKSGGVRHGLQGLSAPNGSLRPPVCRGVYDHTGLRSEHIKILRGIFWELGGLWKV